MSIVVGVNAQRAVGILYINENKDKVRVAQLTFFGHRVDSMYDLNDIMHVADTGEFRLNNPRQLLPLVFRTTLESDLFITR